MGGNEFRVYQTKAIKSKPQHDKAEELLQRIAAQVEPVMHKHQWRCRSLEEFCPRNKGLLGVNINRSKIKIRLRKPSDEDSFFPYEHLLGTMLHELCHMKHSAHSAAFYELLEEITHELEKFMSKGITGSKGIPFASAGGGKALGGGRMAAYQQREASARAAERRLRHKKLMGGGGRRLGGDRSTASIPLRVRLLRVVLQRSERLCGSCSGKKPCEPAAAQPQRGAKWAGSADRKRKRAAVSGTTPKIRSDPRSPEVIDLSSSSDGIAGSSDGRKEKGRKLATSAAGPRTQRRRVDSAAGFVALSDEHRRNTSSREGGGDRWACPRCTLDNESTAQRCAACSAPRLHGQPPATLSRPPSRFVRQRPTAFDPTKALIH